MAKLKTDAITKEDIAEYLESESDFSFEMQVLNSMQDLHFNFEHGGTYTDPITSKVREFDIRAVSKNEPCKLYLAIECKNIRKNYPLLISQVNRHPSEAFHERLSYEQNGSGRILSNQTPDIVRCDGLKSIYNRGEFVGKSINQIGKRESDSEIVGSDGSVFERVSQAINSSYELIQRAIDDRRAQVVSAIIPVLVVPDNRLWVAQYDATGKLVGQPESIEKCQLYLGRKWEMKGNVYKIAYTISHLEIVTISELSAFIQSLMVQSELFGE